MYTVGSVFYGIYFYVAFPMFYRYRSSTPASSSCKSASLTRVANTVESTIYRLDEDVADRWSVSRAAIDSLAASMIVTIFLDLWRLTLVAFHIDTGVNSLPFL